MSALLQGRSREVVVAGLLALVTVLSCWMTYQPSQLYFFGDTWDILFDLLEGGLPAIWHRHNEHLVPIPKFLLYLQYLVFGMDNYPYQVVNILLHSTNTVLLYLCSRRFAVHTVARVFGVLFFSLSGVYWEVTMWETTQQISLAVLFLLLSLLLFDTYLHDQEERWLVWCACSACAATLSMGFGLLVIPLLLCAAVTWPTQNAPRKVLLLRIGLLICVVLLVYIWLRRTSLAHGAGGSRNTIQQNLAAVPALLSWITVGFWQGMIVPNLATAGPLTLVLVCCSLAVVRVRHLSWPRLLLLVLPVAWILGAYLLTGLGRLQTGIEYAASSRYQYLPMVALALVIVWLTDIACECLGSHFSALRAALSAAVVLALLVHAGNGYELIRATSPRLRWGYEARNYVQTVILREGVHTVPPAMGMLEPDYLPAPLYPAVTAKFPLSRALALYAAAGESLRDISVLVPVQHFLNDSALRSLSLLRGLEPAQHLEQWKRFGSVDVALGEDNQTIRLTLPPASAFSVDLGRCCSRRARYTFAVLARLVQGDAHVVPRIVFKNQAGDLLQIGSSEPVAGPLAQPYIVSTLPPLGTFSLSVDLANVHPGGTPVLIEVKDVLLVQHPIYVPLAPLSLK